MRTKDLELDDIGFIGIGRPITEEESKLASAHIQAYMAKHGYTKAKRAPAKKTAKRSPAKRKAKAKTRVA